MEEKKYKENNMKKVSQKELLNYLRERFKDVLVDLKIDIIQKHKDHFTIGFPTFKHSGSGFYDVYGLSDGTIKVIKSYWDESFKDDENLILDTDNYKNIDEWMLKEFYATPSKKKSGTRLNYRNIY
jgi:hypothetical protein